MMMPQLIAKNQRGYFVLSTWKSCSNEQEERELHNELRIDKADDQEVLFGATWWGSNR